MAKRIQWEDLDPALTDAISARTGPILAGRAVTDGKNSPLAAVVLTRDGGKVFVKGLPSDHRMVITQAREAAASPLVTGMSPQLLWQFDDAGWNVLGYEYVDGRSADYRPGSPDIDLIVDLMQTLSTIQVPAGRGPWKPIQTRLRTYVDDPADAAVFAGHALTHTDWMPDNIIISRGRAWLIDWAWATPAQSWIDPASWLIKLIAHGHTISAAEAIATRLPAYAAADPAHIGAFARANANMWNEIERNHPIPWATTMASAARTWAQLRGTP
ncbi:MAG: aminoglycoside phosphotransferase [Pseudonocardia sp.]